MDPLERQGTPKGAGYYQGFYDAEMRQAQQKGARSQRKEGSGAFGNALLLIALPFSLYAMWALGRRMQQRMASISRQAATSAGAGGQASPKTTPGDAKAGGFVGNLMSEFQNMVNPTPRKDFRVEAKDFQFVDVIGIPEALQDVKQYVDFLNHPECFTRLGARLPRGCILTGPPGTGKTLLAKAVAGEAKVPLFSCSGSDFIEVFAGSGPKRVRELFDDARACAPSIIFIDEIDAIGSRRHGTGNSMNSEENRTVNQMLTELDGLDSAGEAAPVVVFAATNFVDSLDKALLRPGRFDRRVELPMPDTAAREELFTHYLGKIVTDGAPEKAQRLATLTPGVAPATISAIVNEGALASAVRGAEKVQLRDLMGAIDDVLVGKKRRQRITPETAKRVALHECGHAMVAWCLPLQPEVVKVSITPRGQAAGFTQQVSREVLDMQTLTSFFTDICVMLGGRCAELRLHKDLTTGAQDDFQRATKKALAAFLAFGMSGTVGGLSFDPQRLEEGRMFQHLSNKLQALAESEADTFVQSAFDFTAAFLTRHEKVLIELSELLFERKELLSEDLRKALGPRAGSEASHNVLLVSMENLQGRLQKFQVSVTEHLQKASDVSIRVNPTAQEGHHPLQPRPTVTFCTSP